MLCMRETEYDELPLNLLRMIDLSFSINYLETITRTITIGCQSLNLNELSEIYKTYTNFGWTIPPAMPYFTKQKATTLEESDSFMLQFCKSENMDCIFSDLQNCEKIDKNDLKEAINCYNHRYYKACALLIFSMIDGILIKLQPQENENRKTSSAFEAMKSKYESNQKMEPKFFIALQANMTIECVKNFYKYANNFKLDDKCIYRNMISHGMLNRAVKETDCIKVFLLLYNILQLLHYQKITELN